MAWGVNCFGHFLVEDSIVTLMLVGVNELGRLILMRLHDDCLTRLYSYRLKWAADTCSKPKMNTTAIRVNRANVIPIWHHSQQLVVMLMSNSVPGGTAQLICTRYNGENLENPPINPSLIYNVLC